MKVKAAWSRLRSKLADKLRFTAALVVAALWSDLTQRVTWERLGRVLRLWTVGLRNEALADEATIAARLACCRACPLWFAPLRTCGSPLSEAPELGCWCEMIQKSKLADATCWLDDDMGEAAPHGWNKCVPKMAAR